MSQINLNFINQSNDKNNSQVVIFQKNELLPSDPVVAWKVIANCTPGESQALKFSSDIKIAAGSGEDEYTAQHPAAHGQRFTFSKDQEGNKLIKDDSGDPDAISFVNSLKDSPANVRIYRDGLLLSDIKHIAHGREKTFAFSDALWIGAVYMVPEGAVIDPHILTDIHQKLILDGVYSADIVMKGGGQGKGAKPFSFHLENVVYV